MRKFKEGDIVEMLTTTAWWQKGDRAKLISRGDCNSWLCNFTMNEEYVQGGYWKAAMSDMKKIENFAKGGIVEDVHLFHNPFIDMVIGCNKSKKPQTGIRIEVEKVYRQPGECYRVLSISALKRRQLPIEYINSDGAVCLKENGNRLLQNRNACLSAILFEVGETYSKEDFQKRIKEVEKAGTMLKEIKRKQWSGKETIII